MKGVLIKLILYISIEYFFKYAVQIKRYQLGVNKK